MQAVLDFINNHVRDIFIPLTALALLRVGMCLAQLKRMTHLREKKGAYHAVRGHCEELGVWFGALAGLLLPVIVPGLWYAGLALAIVGGDLRLGGPGAQGGVFPPDGQGQLLRRTHPAGGMAAGGQQHYHWYAKQQLAHSRKPPFCVMSRSTAPGP